MLGVDIAAYGSYSPPDVLTNQAVIDRFGLTVDDAWIQRATGIVSRRWAADDQATSDLAVGAARDILRGVAEPAEIDRLILATITPDVPSPSTATIVARKLGARCMAFDISAACAGFLYALDVGIQSIRAGAAEQVLVLCADTRSRFLNPTDHRSLVLFGDGAAGVLLRKSDTTPGSRGFLSMVCGAEGQPWSEIGAHVPAGGSRLPASAQTVENGQHYVHIDRKRLIFDQFARFTLEICQEALDKAGVTLADIDVFLTHQGNARLVELLADALGISRSRAISTIAHHGNTAGAAVPMGLADALKAGRIRPGDKVLMSSVGAGSAFGACVVRA